MQKRAKTCKNVHLKYLLTKKRASQVLTDQKTCISRSHLPKNVQKCAKNVQKRAKTCKNVHLKCFWTLFKNEHCQGPCILRLCISRPYCTWLRKRHAPLCTITIILRFERKEHAGEIMSLLGSPAGLSVRQSHHII